MIALRDNRVYRFYEGGLLLDRFVGRAEPRDGDHPGRDPDEGRDPRVAEAVGDLPLLVKLLDTSVRLPIHCHPTRAFARAKFGSFFGKTEAWIVVETRSDDAYVMLGFREGTKKADFRRHLERQDVDDMKACLHRVPVRAGDVWFVQAGLPHAHRAIALPGGRISKMNIATDLEDALLSAMGGLKRMTSAELDAQPPELRAKGLEAVKRVAAEKIGRFVRSAGRA